MARKQQKELTASGVRILGNSPVKVMEAFNALVHYGVDHVKLCRLIENRKRSPGSPKKIDETARLIYSVDEYRDNDPRASVKSAIRGILAQSKGFQKFTSEEKKKKINALAMAYSRGIDGLSPPKALDELSMEEYAIRRNAKS